MNDTSTHYRKHIRLRGLDYREHYAYFVTICMRDRQCVLGKINDGLMQPSQRGLIVERCWADIPNHHSFVELDAFIVMPNHLHGILCFVGDVAATPASPLPHRAHGPAPQSLGSVVGSFKSAVTRSINRIVPGAATKLWQQNYYEHVIRNDCAHDAVRQYILENPQRWDADEENPSGVGTDQVKVFLDGVNQTNLQKGDAGVAATGVR
jgi:putative transposase